MPLLLMRVCLANVMIFQTFLFTATLRNFAAYMTDAIQAVTAVTTSTKAATLFKTEPYSAELQLTTCVGFVRGQSSLQKAR